MVGALRLLVVVATIATAFAAAAAHGGSQALGTRGSWLALVQGGDESRLVLMKPDGSRRRVLVPAEFGVQSPAWRPDGRAIAFVSSRRGNPGIFLPTVTAGASNDWSLAGGQRAAIPHSPPTGGSSPTRAPSAAATSSSPAPTDPRRACSSETDGRTPSPHGRPTARGSRSFATPASPSSRSGRGGRGCSAPATSGRGVPPGRQTAGRSRSSAHRSTPTADGWRSCAPTGADSAISCRTSRTSSTSPGPRQPLARLHPPHLARLGAVPPPALGRRRAQGDAEQLSDYDPAWGPPR